MCTPAFATPKSHPRFTIDPDIFPQVQVDKGAIKHILSGSDIMCPGLTSEGGDVGKFAQGQFVVVMAQGKRHPLAVGRMAMDSQ